MKPILLIAFLWASVMTLDYYESVDSATWCKTMPVIFKCKKV